MMNAIRIGGTAVKPGQRAVIKIPVPGLYDQTRLALTAKVIRGRSAGPCLFISAAVHGDEINGIEIIRRLLKSRLLMQLKGTLIVVPVVNVYGFINQSRYLPDRRDLNRSFPGSDSGSLAERLAHIFLEEVASKATHGIDLHTASIHRDNLPQVRAFLDDPEIRRMALAFPVPVVLNKKLLKGSMRKALRAFNIPVIVYETGEALRLNEWAIRAGVQGIVSVMRELGMLPEAKHMPRNIQPQVAKSSHWLRASQSGILSGAAALGTIVKKGQTLGTICGPLGEKPAAIQAAGAGIIAGRTNIPLVNEGDALFHIAHFSKTAVIADTLDLFLKQMKQYDDQLF